MTSCIFCSSQLSQDTKPEHVWLAALGGRKTTRQVICSSCNNVLGSGPDKALAESVALIRNLLKLASGRGGPPPAIKGLRHRNDRIVLHPGGVPALDGGPPFVITDLPDGNQSIEIRVTNSEELARILPNLAAALKMPLENVKALVSGAQARRTSQKVEGQHHRLSLGGNESMRSMAKTCMTLWADRFGSDELLKTIYDDARQFVRHGGEALAGSICQIDMGKMIGSQQLVDRFGKHFNLAMVASDDKGKAIGYFRLYNICSWRFVLSANGAPPSSIVAYVSNPENPPNWAVAHDESLAAAAHVLDTRPSHDFQSAREALIEINRSYHDRSSQEEINRIFEQSVGTLGLDEGQPMTREQFNQFVGEASARLASWMLKIPYELSLTSDDIARLLGDDEPKA